MPSKNRPASNDTASTQGSADSNSVPSRNSGESTDDYVNRILSGWSAATGGRYNTAALDANARKYGSKLDLQGREYTADKGYLGTQYSSDAQRKASEYGSDAQREASKYGSDAQRQSSMYGADQSRIGSEYGADQGRIGSEYASDAQRQASMYGADQGLAGTRLTSDASRYGSDQSRIASEYGADQGLAGTRLTSEASRYGADQSLAGQRYAADVNERNNQRDAGNQFLQNYATLSSRPSNYFQAQEMLHNGVGAGYGSFVDDAMKTGQSQGGAFNQTRGVGNAAQSMFGQTTGSNHSNDSGLMASTQPEHQFEQGGGGGYPWRWGAYDQGGDSRPSYEASGDGPSIVYRVIDGQTGQEEVPMHQKIMRQEEIPMHQKIMRQVIIPYPTPTVGPAPTPVYYATPSATPSPSDYAPSVVMGEGFDPYDQGGRPMGYFAQDGDPSLVATDTSGGGSWNPDDTTDADKQRLAKIDAATQAGVAKWDSQYWKNLDDDTKDLYRSGWNYLGYSSKGLEQQLADSQAGNQLGAGRMA